MFNHLTIKNFAIVKDLSIDFKNGMTAITGETGAGKSIAIDALGLCLGDRADANSVRTGTQKAEITAEFDISDAPLASRYLEELMMGALTVNVDQKLSKCFQLCKGGGGTVDV